MPAALYSCPTLFCGHLLSLHVNWNDSDKHCVFVSLCGNRSGAVGGLAASVLSVMSKAQTLSCCLCFVAGFEYLVGQQSQLRWGDPMVHWLEKFVWQRTPGTTNCKGCVTNYTVSCCVVSRGQTGVEYSFDLCSRVTVASSPTAHKQQKPWHNEKTLQGHFLQFRCKRSG